MVAGQQENQSGIATAKLTLGAVAGPVKVQAAVTDGTARTPGVEFTATAKAGAPATLGRYGVDSLRLSRVDSTLEYAVYARDGHGDCPQPGCGNLVSGVPITWAIAVGGGTITPAQGTTATDSSSNGYPLSRAVHKVGPNEGTTTVTATVSTGAGAPQVTFTMSVVTAVVEVNWGFTPASVVVSVGKTVGWYWAYDWYADDAHDVTFEDDPRQPVSSPVKNSGFHTRTFSGTPKTIRYRCTLHSTSFTQGEVGVVHVQ